MYEKEIIGILSRMNWTNFHTHTFHCHGKEGPEEYVRSAIDKNMFALGFSGHAPVPFVSEWNMKQERLNGYLNEISRLKNKYQKEIKIYSGLEVDFIPDIIGPKDFRSLKLDFVIGSIHYSGQFENGEHFCLDGTEKEFEKGFKQVFNNDIINLVETYYHNLITMVQDDPPDVIGHLDKIKMFNANNKYFDEKSNWYQAAVKDVIRVIANSRCIVEVNTRGYYKKITQDFYPSNWILQECLKYDIPLTISSDAHNSGELDKGFEKVASLLLNIGYKKVHIFNGNKWQEADLRKNGLKIKEA